LATNNTYKAKYFSACVIHGVSLLAGQGIDSILGYLVAMLGAPEWARLACHTYHSIAREIEPAIANMVSDLLMSLPQS
jgi:hypothetical protein